MNLIIRQATFVTPGQPMHNTINDIQIGGGKIEKIGSGLARVDGYDEISLENLHVSEGWFDASVSFGEPGFEERETIESGIKAAAAGGFTAVALQPNGNPVTDIASHIHHIKSKAWEKIVSIFPIGSLTKAGEGKDLAELFDMKNAGAIAFGDYNKHLKNSNLLKIALQYADDFDALVIAFSQDPDIAGSGMVNEGTAAIRLGLKGIPSIAEEVAIARNLQILEYTNGKLLIPTISTNGALRMIKEAKNKGLNIYCSVSAHHLALTEDVLDSFETAYKVLPPLRSDEDRLALIRGVEDGTIDFIVSDHNPIDVENKNVEFDAAKYGSIGLESCFGALRTVLPTETIVKKLTSAKKIFGIPKTRIEVGEAARLTLFNPDHDYLFTEKNIVSKSRNSLFVGRNLKGLVYGIYNNGKLQLRDGKF